MRPKIVTPRVRANGLWNPFTGRKKWRITCGDCRHCWDEKVPAQERCSALCPCCGAQNVWSLSDFLRAYDRQQ